MSRRNLVAYAKALVKAGVMEEPAWMGALTRSADAASLLLGHLPREFLPCTVAI